MPAVLVDRHHEAHDSLLRHADDRDRVFDAGKDPFDDGAALVEHELRRYAAPGKQVDHLAGPITRGLFVVPEAEVYIIVWHEALAEQRLDGLENHHERTLIVEGATTPDHPLACGIFCDL